MQFGPVEDWGRQFRAAYGTVRASQDAQAVDRFLENVSCHVRTGKAILAEFMNSSVIEPPANHSVRGDFLLAGDLLGILHRGIAILEARLDIVAPAGPLPSQQHSDIRRHMEFEHMM